jgi:hypothetical protein
VNKKLNKIKPTLQHFKANREFWSKKWKKFKENYTITSTTMQVLLEAPNKEFFSSTMQTGNKNRINEQLSLYAKEFF